MKGTGGRGGGGGGWNGGGIGVCGKDGPDGGSLKFNLVHLASSAKTRSLTCCGTTVTAPISDRSVFASSSACATDCMLMMIWVCNSGSVPTLFAASV